MELEKGRKAVMKMIQLFNKVVKQFGCFLCRDLVWMLLNLTNIFLCFIRVRLSVSASRLCFHALTAVL